MTRPYHQWTKQQEQLLRQRYATHSLGQIARLLRRDPTSVHSKINKLGLKKHQFIRINHE